MFETLFVPILTMSATLTFSMYHCIWPMHMYWASLCFPIVSMAPTKTSSLGQVNITFNNGHHTTLSQPLKQMVAPYL